MDLQDRLQSELGTAYTIERELAGGGMSRVFVAREATLARRVVVKTLSPDLAGAVSIDRFRREIRLVAALQQANIVPVLTAGEMDAVPYFTMPFVEGENLRARLLKHGAFPVVEAVSVLRDVARALAYAHERGIVHRDVKPENILLSGETAVVTDFGIAKALEAARTGPDAPTLTQFGVVLGTPAYMSPEQACGERQIDHRTDIYSLGVLAYELLTGTPPFTGQTPQALIAAHIVEQPADVATKRPAVGVTLARLVMRCLAKDPAIRPTSAQEVLRVLDSLPAFISGPAVEHGAAEAKSKVMVAVLPFANMSPSADDEYFSDGITEDIIAQLSQIGCLSVISRTSAMRYKKSEDSVRDIAAALGATHVVEGSVRRASNRLRIVAELIEADTDTHLWAQTFDRDLTDVFAIQSEVAERIAGALRMQLSADEQRRIARKPTKDQDAYNLFLLARHNWNRGTHDGFARAEELCEQAIARDPGFARAWAAVALANAFHVGGYLGLRPRDAVPKWVRYAGRALELDPQLAEAHMMLGCVPFVNYDWESARSAFARAVDLNPNLPEAHLFYGFSLLALGQPAGAVEAGERALALDPASEIVHVWANFHRYLARRLDDGLTATERAEAQYGPGTLTLVRQEILTALGRAGEAVDPIRKLYELAPSSWHQAHLAWTLAAAGGEREARDVLRQIHVREQSEYVWPVAIALAYAHLGDMDTAFDYLERCYRDGISWMAVLHSPPFDPLRADSRLDEMIRRVGVVPPAIT